MTSLDDFDNRIKDFSLQYDEDPYLMERLAYTESRGNPYAVGPVTASGDQAQGAFQLMPATSLEMGVTDPFDPAQSAQGGIGYFSKMKDQTSNLDGGNLGYADAAYNWGPGNLKNLIGQLGTEDMNVVFPHLPAETQDHMAKVLSPSTGPIQEDTTFLSKPLPAAPNFSGPGSYGRSSQGDMALPDDSARKDALARVSTELEGLQGLKAGVLGSLGKEGEISSNDAVATALTALIPTLIGWAAHGKQGAAMGGQAGASGAMVGLKGFADDMARRDANNKLLYEDLKQRITSKEAEASNLERSILDRGDRVSDLQYLYGAGGARNHQQGWDDNTAGALQAAADGTATPEQMALIYNNKAALSAYQRAQGQNKNFDADTADALATPRDQRTPEQIRLIAANPTARRQDLQNRDLDLKGSRLTDKEKSDTAKKTEGIPSDYKLIDGSSWSSKSIIPVQKRVATYYQAKDAINTLKNELLDPNASLQQQEHAKAAVVLALKDLNGLGARFSEQQIALEKSRIPAIPDWTSPDEFTKWIQFNARGGDPRVALDNLTNWISLQNDAALRAYNLVPDSSGTPGNAGGTGSTGGNVVPTEGQIFNGQRVKAVRKIN